MVKRGMKSEGDGSSGDGSPQQNGVKGLIKINELPRLRPGQLRRRRGVALPEASGSPR